MRHWLVVWGSAVEQIRAGEGENEAVAGQYAFGMYQRDMTFMEVTLHDLRTDWRRTRKCFLLLHNHAARIEKAALEDGAAIKLSALREAAEIEKRWRKTWARFDTTIAREVSR
jgi:hypothetical protein